MKSLIALLRCVLIDLGTRCDVSTSRDLKKITARFEREGLSFLGITLPTLAKGLEKGLDQGWVDPSLFPGFQCRGRTPKLLGGFFDLVFDRDSGRLDVKRVEAIKAIRQITLMWAKIELPCTPERNASAFDAYIKTEEDVRLSDKFLSLSEPDLLNDFERIGRLLWASYFTRVDLRVHNDGVVPRHGPGATADKLRGNAKYNVTLWPRRLEEVFPHWENIIPSERSVLESTEWLDRVDIHEPVQEVPVRVITVPKTLKTPRIIAIEPTAMQYMQQGVLRMMVEEMPNFDQTRNLVRFESQEPNQWLAREGSVLGTLATLDLSEASDRVSYQHVRLLLRNHPHLLRAVDATRSRKADVPGHGVIRLAKFASMGSALCFPFEAIVFATVIFVGIERALGRPLRRSDLSEFYGRVRVYGDDIIVPVHYAVAVKAALEAFGFKVNSGKSFWNGKFRESCGKEWYDGEDVSVVRVRAMLPLNRQDVEDLESAVSLRNQCFHKGYFETTSFLDEWIRKLIPFPQVEWSEVWPDGYRKVPGMSTITQSSILLGRHEHYPSQVDGHDTKLHLPLVRGAVRSSRIPESYLDGPGALMKWFLMKMDSVEPIIQKDHLLRAGRPDSARITIRWAPPY